MARQTRAQRRARRAQMTPSAEAALPRRPAGPRAEARPEPSREPRALPGGGFRRFLGESWGELRKVEWPTQNQLIQGVVVVIIACVIVGVFLWGSDLVLKRLVEKVLLGQ